MGRSWCWARDALASVVAAALSSRHDASAIATHNAERVLDLAVDLWEARAPERFLEDPPASLLRSSRVIGTPVRGLDERGFAHALVSSLGELALGNAV